MIGIYFFKNLCNNIPNKYISELSSVYYSGAFEINSNNFKITSNGKSILLKNGQKNNSKRLIKTQKLINWLNNRNIPYSLFLGALMIKILYFNLRIRFGVLIYLRMEIIIVVQNQLESAAKVTGKIS